MKRITKLSAETIKRIIKEERKNINDEILEANKEANKEAKKKLYEALKFLKKVNQRKQKTIAEQKILEKMTTLMVKQIKKEK